MDSLGTVNIGNVVDSTLVTGSILLVSSESEGHVTIFSELSPPREFQIPGSGPVVADLESVKHHPDGLVPSIWTIVLFWVRFVDSSIVESDCVGDLDVDQQRSGSDVSDVGNGAPIRVGIVVLQLGWFRSWCLVG